MLIVNTTTAPALSGTALGDHVAGPGRRARYAVLFRGLSPCCLRVWSAAAGPPH